MYVRECIRDREYVTKRMLEREDRERESVWVCSFVFCDNPIYSSKCKMSLSLSLSVFSFLVSSLKGVKKIHFEFENIHCTVQRVRRAIKFFTRIWEQEIYNSQLKGYNLNLLFSCTFCIPTLYLFVICNLTKSS